MRYYEVHEPLSEKSVRMGAKDLAKTDLAGVLVGFEFEMAVPTDTAWNTFLEKKKAEYDIDEWMGSFLISDFIKYYDAKPLYGWASQTKVYDRHEEEISIYDIFSVKDMEELFTLPDRVWDDFEKYVDDDMEERMGEFREVFTHIHYGDDDYITEIGSMVVDKFPYSVVVANEKVTTETKTWILTKDGSIRPAGVELVSPPLPAREAISALNTALQFIRNTPEITTNSTTGLHVNVSVAHPEKIDLLKLSLLMGEGHILDSWGRADNTYTMPILRTLRNFVKDKSISKENISYLNSMILSKAGHHYSVDFTKLANGYLEFRAAGGEGYENRAKEIENLVMRYVRLIQIASDVTAEREAYLAKLARFLDGITPRSMSLSLDEIGIQKSDYEQYLSAIPITDNSLKRTDVAHFLSSESASSPREKMLFNKLRLSFNL